MIFLLIIIIF